MSTRSYLILCLAIVSAVVLSTCGPTNEPANPPPTSAPSTGSCITSQQTKGATNTKTPGDVSSVTIPAGTYAESDPSGTPWCNTQSLGMSWIDVSDYINKYGCFTDRNRTSCDPYHELAAYDVQPSPVRFPNPSPRPNLLFDLNASPVGCVKDNTCYFEIYQLKEPVPATPEVAWLAVGDAVLKNTSTGNPYAEGDISHFSRFALVQLPPPRSVNPTATLVTLVASQFFAEPGGPIRVAFTIRESTPRIQEISQTRIFRLNGLKELTVSKQTPPSQCPRLRDLGQQLTCLFPIGMPVSISVTSATVEITSVDKNYAVKFSATVQIF